jgi:tetratricopeptide (TPR) repeat protein
MIKRILLLITSLFFLSACSNGYTVDVDLDESQRAQINQEIQSIKADLKKAEGEAEVFLMMDLARAYKKLGQLGKAIDIYEDYLARGKRVKAMMHNLGRLYEDVAEYDKAIEQYQRLIDDYYDRDYLYDITWVYIRAGERKQAEKYFNAWQLEFQKTDEKTQEAIKKLREDEKTIE